MRNPSGDSQEQDGVRVRFQEAEGATEVGPFNLFTTPLDVLAGGWLPMDSAPRDGTPVWLEWGYSRHGPGTSN